MKNETEASGESRSLQGLPRRRLLTLGGATVAGSVLVGAPGAAHAAREGAPSRAFAPVPPRALRRTMPAKGYIVEPVGVRDGAFHVTDGTYNTIFFVTDDRVVVVDAPTALGAKTLEAIREVTANPVTHAIYSHAHNDHIGAMGIYGSGVTYVAHADTVRYLQRKSASLPRPTVVWKGRRAFQLCVDDVVLTLTDEGRAHQPGNLFVWSGSHRVLMTVDVAFPRWAPFKNLAIAADVLAIPEAVDALLRYPFRHFVGGHLDKAVPRADIEEQRAYLEDLFAACRRANTLVDYVQVTAGVDPNNVWAQFDTYADAVTRRAMQLVSPAWNEQLGGADVFLEDNCFVVTEAYRIDG
jgi:glyoxylase-like metal-dependent hydrolase (beta-lactamase superfamily II)